MSWRVARRFSKHVARASLLTLCASVVTVACSLPSFRPEHAVVNLVDAFASAKKEPRSDLFDVGRIETGKARSTAIEVAGASRLTFIVDVPVHARFRTGVGVLRDPTGAAVSLSVGISDGHVFRQIASRTIAGETTSGRIDVVDANLDEYAGLTVALILNTRCPPTSNPSDVTKAAWIDPTVVAR